MLMSECIFLRMGESSWLLRGRGDPVWLRWHSSRGGGRRSMEMVKIMV